MATANLHINTLLYRGPTATQQPLTKLDTVYGSEGAWKNRRPSQIIYSYFLALPFKTMYVAVPNPNYPVLTSKQASLYSPVSRTASSVWKLSSTT